MKLEYFPDGSEDCPLILIYGTGHTEIKELVQAFNTLSNRTRERVAIHELPGFVSVDGCQLFASVGKRDLGVRLLSENTFDWILRSEMWEQVTELAEPFQNFENPSETHFQYLNPTIGISVLISTNRSW